MVQDNINEIFSAEEIARFTADGHWPPPDGIIFLKETTPDPRAVQQLGFSLTINFLQKGKLDEAATLWEIFDLNNYDGTEILGIKLVY